MNTMAKDSARGALLGLAVGDALGTTFEFPYGEGAEISTPGPHRLAIYELTRPGASEHLRGRRDW